LLRLALSKPVSFALLRFLFSDTIQQAMLCLHGHSFRQSQDRLGLGQAVSPYRIPPASGSNAWYPTMNVPKGQIPTLRAISRCNGKLERMRDNELISPSQVNVIFSAFDAGSAAVHRGNGPKLQDVHTMLDIAEALIMQFYVDPAMEKRREVAAAELKKNTPPRRKP
jgi:hypothetical protein